MKKVVELEDVSFSYTADRVLVDRFSLTAYKGQVVALMGGSGAGKSTLLQIMAGLLHPQKGRVSILGADPASLSTTQMNALRKKIGFLFQFGALFTDLSVFDNVAFPMREVLSLPESVIHDLVLMKLESVGLRLARELFLAALSGGMAKRAALARAIALDPLVIFYDEPFSGLDPISMSIVAELIRRLNDALGACSIMVTHDVPTSFKIVDYVYFVSQGRLVGQGTPDQLLHTSDPVIAQFIHGLTDGPLPFHYAMSSREPLSLPEDYQLQRRGAVS